MKIEHVIQAEGGILEEDLEMILQLMQDYGSIRYAMERAQDYVERAKGALNHFPDSIHRQALLTLADYIIAREY
jgi:octaprenyl-diphosphate synthase